MNILELLNKEKTVAHISFPIFNDFHSFQPRVYKEIIDKLLSVFIPKKLIVTNDLPSTTRLSVSDGEGYSLLNIKVTYPEIRGNRGVVEEQGELLPGKHVSVLGEYKAVKRLPDGENAEFYVNNGYTHITLPAIVGFDMFLLEK